MIHRKRVENFTFGLEVDHPLTKVLVSYLLKDGKKALAVRLVNSVTRNLLLKIAPNKEEGVKISELLDKVQQSLNLRVNFVKRRSGSRTHRIPYHMEGDFAFRFGVKKMVKLISSQRKKDRGVVNKISEEIWSIFSGEGSSVFLTEKHRMYTEAKAKRSLSYMISRFRVQDPTRLRIDLTKLKD